MESKQMTLATAGFAIKTKVTRRAQFLAEMDKVVPWSRLLAVIEPHYPVAEQGRPRPPLERMLRIYFMQQWFNLSDPAMEDALYDSEAMRRFAGIDPGADVVPGQEGEIFGDQAYWSEEHRRHCRRAGIRYRINRRARPGRTLTKRERETNRRRSATRARGEHAFHVVKTLWGFAKVRYRGLMKNTVRAFAAFALANLYLARRTLLAT